MVPTNDYHRIMQIRQSYYAYSYVTRITGQYRECTRD